MSELCEVQLLSNAYTGLKPLSFAQFLINVNSSFFKIDSGVIFLISEIITSSVIFIEDA